MKNLNTKKIIITIYVFLYLIALSVTMLLYFTKQSRYSEFDEEGIFSPEWQTFNYKSGLSCKDFSNLVADFRQVIDYMPYYTISSENFYFQKNVLNSGDKTYYSENKRESLKIYQDGLDSTIQIHNKIYKFNSITRFDLENEFNIQLVNNLVNIFYRSMCTAEDENGILQVHGDAIEIAVENPKATLFLDVKYLRPIKLYFENETYVFEYEQRKIDSSLIKSDNQSSQELNDAVICDMLLKYNEFENICF